MGMVIVKEKVKTNSSYSVYALSLLILGVIELNGIPIGASIGAWLCIPTR